MRSSVLVHLGIHQFAPGFAVATRAVAARTAGILVTAPLDEWYTTTFGGRTPAPKALSVRCPVS